MDYYFAPLEGITGYVYRNAHHKFFPGTDRYYTPFVAPNYTKHFKAKEKKDVAPENNAGVPVVPQVLSNKADETLWAVEELAKRGYREVNLNLGCPMPTVARKKKGSGLLKFTDELDAYLDGVFEGMARRPSECPPVQISVKTRLGTDSTQEAEALVRIYNRYPISELIVHPRSREDMYRGVPDREAFLLVLQNSAIPVVYNGNLCRKADWKRDDRARPSRGSFACAAVQGREPDHHEGAGRISRGAVPAAGRDTSRKRRGAQPHERIVVLHGSALSRRRQMPQGDPAG